MNIMCIRSLMPTLRVAPPAAQHRVCHSWMRSDRARSTSRSTCTCAEDVTSYCPGGNLNTRIGVPVRRARPKSP